MRDKNAFTFSLISRLIHQERDRQKIKWGEQNREPLAWFTILAEEIGETAKALCDELIDAKRTANHDHIAVELIQSAAVIYAFLDCLHRHELIRLDYLSLDS